MRLLVLGSNATYPTPGRPASGYLLEEGGSSVWLDAGSGTFTALLERRDPASVDALVLTHIHGDHCLDLFPLFNMFREGPHRRRGVPVYVPRDATDHLASFVRAGPGHDFFVVFDFEAVEPGDEASVGALVLRFAEADHSVPSLAVRVEGSGRSLTYSGDTGPGGGLLRLAGASSVLLCEATLQGRRPPDGYPYHLHAAEAGEIAARAGVERLFLTHVAPTLDPAVSVAEAAAVFDGPIVWAAPGWEGEV